MRKTAVLSDIHSNYIVLKEILNELEKENIDEYLFCGDYVVNGFEDNEVLETIHSLNTKNIIAGNRDVSIATYNGHSWKDLNQFKAIQYSYDNITKKNLDFLKSLPIFKIITLEGKKIYFAHGAPDNVREQIYKDSYDIFDKLIDRCKADIYITGHTHFPFCKRYKNKLFINPGTVGAPIDGNPISTYAILEIDGDNISYSHRVFNYDYNVLKEHYLNSEFHQKCKEWSNLTIYMFRDGFDYYNEFVQFVNKETNGDEKETSRLWNEMFLEYFKMKKLKVL